MWKSMGKKHISELVSFLLFLGTRKAAPEKRSSLSDDHRDAHRENHRSGRFQVAVLGREEADGERTPATPRHRRAGGERVCPQVEEPYSSTNDPSISFNIL